MNLEKKDLIKKIDELKKKIVEWPPTDIGGEAYLGAMQRILSELGDRLEHTIVGETFLKIKEDFSQEELEYIDDILYLISGMLEFFETGGIY